MPVVPIPHCYAIFEVFHFSPYIWNNIKTKSFNMCGRKISKMFENLTFFRITGGFWCKIEGNVFYVTDGNIMYLTDASRSLISCVIQHYAPVVGWGVEEQMHNVDYDPGP